MAEDTLEWLGDLDVPDPEAGQTVQLHRGLTVRQNSKNPFLVVSLRYEADPSKDPKTEEGAAWVRREQRDMGCFRICRECDTPWSVDDETCADCLSETELVLSNKWKREYEIDYAAQSGSYVFDAFSEARNTCDPFRIPADWRRYRIVDHGFRNPTAVLWAAVDKDGGIWVYGEHYEAGQGVDWHARRIHQVSSRLDYHVLDLTTGDLMAMDSERWQPPEKLIKDQARIYRTIGDPSMGSQVRKEIQTIRHRYAENGVFIQKANNSVAGLEIANSMFSAGTLTIFKNCVNTKREVSNLVWAENRDPALNQKEREVDRNNHTTDCIKYLMNAFAPKSEDKDPARPMRSMDDWAQRDRERAVGKNRPSRPTHFTDFL